MSHIDRRTFLASTAAASVVAVARPLSAKAPELLIPQGVKPIVVASANGHRYKNGGAKTGVEIAFEKITKGDDVLDALIAGVNLCELDPADTSVGYGGLPNHDGVVQLDASCMHGPKKRAGAVGALEGVRTPSLVAKAVMEQTDHHLIVGKDAQTFARNMGFKIEDDLNTEQSRKTWLEWKRRTDPSRYLDPIKREAAMNDVVRQMVKEGLIDEQHVYGTINCDGINAKGEICGVTTTSGLAWKIPGRVGDSPLVGCGLYVDNDTGAAGSTGRGEEVIYINGARTVVEYMRRGASPEQACLDALKLIAARYGNDREKLKDIDVNFYALNKRGEFGGAAIWNGSMNSRGELRRRQFAAHDGREGRLFESAYLFERRG